MNDLLIKHKGHSQGKLSAFSEVSEKILCQISAEVLSVGCLSGTKKAQIL